MARGQGGGAAVSEIWLLKSPLQLVLKQSDFYDFQGLRKKSEKFLKIATAHVASTQYELAIGQATSSGYSPDKSYDFSLFHFFTCFGSHNAHVHILHIDS